MTNDFRGYVRPSQALVPVAADSGEVWILHHVSHSFGMGSEGNQIDTYLDPAKAIRDLAGRIRPRWSWMTDPLHLEKPEGMPATPPENDFEAVAWYFAKPYRIGHERHETFELWRVRPDQEVIERPAGAPEYGLSETYQEMVCVCGNVASDAGFTHVDEHGRDVVPGSDWLRCEGCARILHAMTGRVTKTLPTADCANCINGVIAVSREGLFLGEGYPYVDGDLVWVHPDQDRVYARCSGGGVAAPRDPQARRCGQCGGDRADWAHRQAAHHPRAEWAPEHAAGHPPLPEAVMEPVRSLAERMDPEAIECALRTLAEYRREQGDPDLSDRQVEVADQVARMAAQDDDEAARQAEKRCA